MGPNNLKVQKSFFIRYLKDGNYDLQFELLDRSTLLNTRWSCENNGYAQVFDKIRHTIHVSRRVDVDEHFRQVVVHRQRKPGSKSTVSRVTNLLSLPDVVQFKNTGFDNGTSLSTVGITSTEQIYDISMEFSGRYNSRRMLRRHISLEFIPSLPLRDLNNFVEMRNSPRQKRKALYPESLSDVIGDLSLYTFQPKPKANLQANGDDLEENQQNEVAIGNRKLEGVCAMFSV